MNEIIKIFKKKKTFENIFTRNIRNVPDLTQSKMIYVTDLSFCDDIFINICTFLDLSNLIKMNRIHSDWNEIANSYELWSQVFKRDFLGNGRFHGLPEPTIYLDKTTDKIRMKNNYRIAHQELCKKMIKEDIVQATNELVCVKNNISIFHPTRKLKVYFLITKNRKIIRYLECGYTKKAIVMIRQCSKTVDCLMGNNE